MNVLVIEDDPEFCEILVKSLSDWGHDPTAVFNWFSVMRVLGSDQFDLIVTDIETPTGNALDAFESLNHDDQIRKIPKVVISGRQGKEIDHACLAIGARYIHKSATFMTDLRAVVEDMVLPT
ncbi:response regulator [Rhodopirellula bahusiensis]|uniref:response regulator n=1 Tax=Rhodopirellula bahusiensis TaxID=2014065 RepID=UPI0032673ECB